MTTNTKAKAPGFIKASLLRWLGIPIRLTDGDFWAAYHGTVSKSGQVVTVETAIQLTAVYACVRLLSHVIASLPFRLYERTSDEGNAKAATDHPVYNIIHKSPNKRTTAFEFWQLMLSSLLLPGTAYAEKQYIGGRLVALEFLVPTRLWLSSYSREVYTYTNRDGTQREIPASRVWKLNAFSLDGENGLSPIRAGCDAIGNALAAEAASAGVFKNGLSASGFVSDPKYLTDKQREDFREHLKTFSTDGINSGKTMLLEGGKTYTQIKINPEDAQLLETRGFSIEQICSLYGVIPFMIGHTTAGQTVWGSGMEQQLMMSYMLTYMPWIRRIEQSADKNLLTPEESEKYYTQFALEALLRADSAARANLYSSALQNGWLNRNTVRKLENQPPIPGGEIYTVQSNLIPLDQLGMAPPAPEGNNVRAALMQWLGWKEPKQ